MAAEKLREELEKYQGIIAEYAEKHGLKVEIGPEGDFQFRAPAWENKKAIESVVVTIGLAKKGNYVSIHINDSAFMDSVYEELVRMIAVGGTSVIFIPAWINRQK